jgi:prepilin-type N-terminal cleavage/methylation domain-containing protein
MQKRKIQTNTKIFDSSHKSQITSHFSKGFTLIEIMVTVAIFAVITSVILARNSKFDDETLLQSAAYEVALSVRTAQNYGIDVLGQEGNYDSAYGVYFPSVSSSYVLFRDVDGDNVADEGETVETYELNRGFTIQKVCSLPDANVNPGCESATREEGISILFKRPDPEALVYTVANGMVQDATPGALIEIASPRGGQRFVVVLPTGQIGLLKASQVGNPDLPPLGQ